MIRRDADQAIVPNDAKNADWQTYQAWLAAGNTPTPASAPTVVTPRYISKRVVVERLASAGLLAAAFSALGGPGALQYERWSASASVDTQNADVLGLLAAIHADAAVILAPTPDDPV